MKSKMKPWEFYTLTVIAFANLVIGFFGKNIWISLVGLGIALYLKPHVKDIPIGKSYKKILDIDEDEDITIEDLTRKK